MDGRRTLRGAAIRLGPVRWSATGQPDLHLGQQAWVAGQGDEQFDCPLPAGRYRSYGGRLGLPASSKSPAEWASTAAG